MVAKLSKRLIYNNGASTGDVLDFLPPFPGAVLVIYSIHASSATSSNMAIYDSTIKRAAANLDDIIYSVNGSSSVAFQRNDGGPLFKTVKYYWGASALQAAYISYSWEGISDNPSLMTNF